MEIVTVKTEGFTGRAHHEGTTIRVVLEGTADYAALDALEMLLARIQAEAARRGITEAAVDLRELEFMNSSCFKTFVSWLSEIQDLEPDLRYKVRFVSNPNLHWQKRSLHSLQCFAVDLVTVVAQP